MCMGGFVVSIEMGTSKQFGWLRICLALENKAKFIKTEGFFQSWGFTWSWLNPAQRLTWWKTSSAVLTSVGLKNSLIAGLELRDTAEVIVAGISPSTQSLQTAGYMAKAEGRIDWTSPPLRQDCSSTINTAEKMMNGGLEWAPLHNQVSRTVNR